MLVGLRPAREPGAPAGVAEMLLACHERIRRFSALGVLIASAGTSPAEEVAAAAGAVHRYFTVALPLHVADEDESLRPRLLALPPTDALARALDVMTAEHVTIEEHLRALAPLWDAARSNRAGAADLAREHDAARRLETLLASHLALEEESIFPVLRSLDAAASGAIVAEMKKRRGTA